MKTSIFEGLKADIIENVPQAQAKAMCERVDAVEASYGPLLSDDFKPEALTDDELIHKACEELVSASLYLAVLHDRATAKGDFALRLLSGPAGATAVSVWKSLEKGLMK